MRGKKPYNIRNIEAHISNFNNKHIEETSINTANFGNQLFSLNKNMMVQTKQTNKIENNIIYQPSQQQQINEYINAKYGVTKYASNLVSGKMFKKI